jgi:hypothetical protein
MYEKGQREESEPAEAATGGQVQGRGCRLLGQVSKGWAVRSNSQVMQSPDRTLAGVGPADEDRNVMKQAETGQSRALS